MGFLLQLVSNNDQVSGERIANSLFEDTVGYKYIWCTLSVVFPRHMAIVMFVEDSIHLMYQMITRWHRKKYYSKPCHELIHCNTEWAWTNKSFLSIILWIDLIHILKDANWYLQLQLYCMHLFWVKGLRLRIPAIQKIGRKNTLKHVAKENSMVIEEPCRMGYGNYISTVFAIKCYIFWRSSVTEKVLRYKLRLDACSFSKKNHFLFFIVPNFSV